MTGREDSEGDRDLLRRCDEFTLGLDKECADRVDPVEGGYAVLTPSLPLVWALNYVIFEQPGIPVERMVEICDGAMGEAGLAHRTVITTCAAEGERLEAGFRRLGWDVDPALLMVLRSADRPPAGVEIRRTQHPTDLRRALMTEDDLLRKQTGSPGELSALVEQLLEMERRLDAVAGDHWYVAGNDGAPASACRLLSRGGFGQIEDVATLPSARNRGLATATVLAAAEASREEGNELTFIIAAADDWPHKLYEKLGFAPVGTVRSFRAPSGSRDTGVDARG